MLMAATTPSDLAEKYRHLCKSLIAKEKDPNR
jgi:hypothetical protein